MKKKIASIVLVIMLFALGSATAIATGVVQEIKAQLRPDLTIIIDGETKTFADVNGNTVYPIMYNGTTYLPLRAIGGMMGKEVGWDGTTNTVTLKSPSYDLGGSLVYEDSKVCIRFSRCYQGTSYYSSYYYAEFTIQNKTNAELAFQCSALGFNGISYNNLSGSEEVAASSTGKIGFYTSKDALPTSGISTISGKIDVIDFAKSISDWSYEAAFTNVSVK